MMTVPGVGNFLRALFRIEMSEGHALTYGVWVGVDAASLHRAFELWWAPSYPTLQISGYLANPVPPWGLLGSPVDLTVLDPDATPYCTSSSDPFCRLALTQVWDHDVVLRTI